MDVPEEKKLKERLRVFFSPGGALSKKLEGYEPRSSQAEMALACLDALLGDGVLVVEAGTGTGKTLAYLVPSLSAGRRVVVSTGTKNLQEQLFFKDLPFLKSLGGKFTAAVMKGRGNYLCLRKFSLFRQQPMLKGMEEVDQFRFIEDWANATSTGDFAELSNLPDTTPIFGPLSCKADNCVGRRCPQYEKCWLVKMRSKAALADVVIVNHHLLFADAALRDTGFGAVVPEYDRVILDEAHDLEDVATSYFGAEISNWRFEELARDAVHEFANENISEQRLVKGAAAIGAKGHALFSLMKAPADRFITTAVLSDNVLSAKTELDSQLQDFEATIGTIDDCPESLFKLAQRSTVLRETLSFVLDGGDPDFVFWGERRGRGIFLRASPIDVSGQLRNFLLDGMNSTILTSATLAVGGSFEYISTRLGVDHAEELQLPSHFDFRHLTRLYVPDHLPDPNAEGFLPRAAAEIIRILELTQGRAFILFTSLRNMERAYDLLTDKLPYPLLLQGTSSRRELLQRFREEDGAVLLASASFWQGIDVRGPNLSCVIIDKLPFAVPDDPIVSARMNRIKREGGDPFWQYQVPSAALSLKQGLGRLVRSSTDRGIMAVLDSRLLKRRYGRVFLSSLHGSPVVRTYEELKRWW